jgi:DNA modification methylase
VKLAPKAAAGDAAAVNHSRVLRPAGRGVNPAPESFYTVHVQDARRLDLLLSEYSSPASPLLTSTITSPPYGALKDYGHPDQIGHGQLDDEYMMDLRRVFRSLYSHTKTDGSMWIVVDTLRRKPAEGDMWPMQLLPFQVAQEAELVGWTLRDVVIWVKDKTLPWSSKGRMRNGFEYILFFVKSSSFKYHVDRLREPDDLEQWWVRYPERYNPQGKAPANVWAVPIPVQGSWANTAVQHACPLPADLVERMLLLSTDDGDVVLDPFAGSGVVVAEAKRLGRRGLGVELVERHVDAFHSTVLPEITERRGVDVVQERNQLSKALQRTILDLRAVKYPKSLMREARKIDPTLPTPFAAYGFRSSRASRDGRMVLRVVIALEAEDMPRCSDYLRAAERAARRKPVSKFGIQATIEVCRSSDVRSLHRGRRLWAYVDGKTHRAAGRCTAKTVDRQAAEPSRHGHPLVVSNVYVDETPRRLTGA